MCGTWHDSPLWMVSPCPDGSRHANVNTLIGVENHTGVRVCSHSVYTLSVGCVYVWYVDVDRVEGDKDTRKHILG